MCRLLKPSAPARESVARMSQPTFLPVTRKFSLYRIAFAGTQTSTEKNESILVVAQDHGVPDTTAAVLDSAMAVDTTDPVAWIATGWAKFNRAAVAQNTIIATIVARRAKAHEQQNHPVPDHLHHALRLATIINII